MIDVLLNSDASTSALDSMAIAGVGLMLGSFMLSTAGAMNFALKMMIFALKMLDLELKMLDFDS